MCSQEKPGVLMRKETLARRFNQNAALAIEDLLLLDTGERDELPAVRIAKFLHEAEGLDAARVGEFLCHDDQLSARVIQALLTQKRCTGLSIDEALQAFLAGILLPAHLESAEIVLIAFSRHYHVSNPEVFDSVDVVEAFCISAILLSINLHHNVKARISRDRYVQYCEQLSDRTHMRRQLLCQSDWEQEAASGEARNRGSERREGDFLPMWAEQLYDKIAQKAIHAGESIQMSDAQIRSMSSVPTQQVVMLHLITTTTLLRYY
jgi:hypothetical protein